MSRFVILSAARVATLQASLSATEASDSLSADAILGAVSRIADAAITEAGDSLAAGGAGAVVATLARTEAADTSSAAAVATTVASIARTEAADSVAAAAAAPAAAALSALEAGDSCAGAGLAAIGAVLAGAEDFDSLAAAAVAEGGAPAADAAITEGDDVPDALGALLVLGALSVQEDADTLDAAAGPPPVVLGAARGRTRPAAPAARAPETQRGTRWAPRSSPRQR